MELRDIKALIALMRENGLIELEVEDKKGKIRLVRTGDFGPQPSSRQIGHLLWASHPGDQLHDHLGRAHPGNCAIAPWS